MEILIRLHISPSEFTPVGVEVKEAQSAGVHPAQISHGLKETA